MSIIKLILLPLLTLGVYRTYRTLTNIPDPPVLDPNPWWGEGDPIHRPSDKLIRPFAIKVSDEALADLQTRLSLPLRVLPPLVNANFTYGFNSEVLKEVQKHWLTKYNWRQREARLNRFKQFTTKIEGLDIHFIHVKPNPKDLGPKTKVVPLLLSHGWPGSVVEFDEILPILTKPWGGKNGAIAFEVIAPSLPGYGFSQAASKQGLGAFETAQIFLKLMKRVGHEKFYAQGGDWGSLISDAMAVYFPDNILGLHVNMINCQSNLNTLKHILGSYLPAGTFMDIRDELNLYPVSNFFSYLLSETGYMHLQATKPDTIGSALNESPIGLAAYILEKFSGWTHKENIYRTCGGLLDPKFPISLDRMLDNVCLYWFTNSITSSVRFYKETFVPMFTSQFNSIPVTVPTGLAAFPQEIFNSPETFAKSRFKDLVSYTRMPAGGHFAAMEQPKLLAEDIFKFVTKVEQREKKVKEEL